MPDTRRTRSFKLADGHERPRTSTSYEMRKLLCNIILNDCISHFDLITPADRMESDLRMTSVFEDGATFGQAS